MSSRVLVIGGGIIGLTTAFALHRQGYEVVLLDKNKENGCGTSYANGGQLSYHYVAPLAAPGVPSKAFQWMFRKASPLKLTPRLDRQQWRWVMNFLRHCRAKTHHRHTLELWTLATLSREVLHEWQHLLPLTSAGWQSSGKLVVYRHQDDLQHAWSGHLSDHQRLLTAEECVELEPSLNDMAAKLAGAILTPGDEVIDTFLFCQVLTRYLHAQPNCRIVNDCEVTGFLQQGNRVLGVSTLTDNQPGEWYADETVLAAGMDSYRLAGMLGLELPLYGLKGYSLTLPIRGKCQVPYTSVTDQDNKIVYARLKGAPGEPDQLRIAAMVDMGDRENTLNPRRIEALKAKVKETFPGLEGVDEAQAWAGMRPATPSGKPIIGPCRKKGLWLNIGHGALGLTLACGSATLMCEQISGEKPRIDTRPWQLLKGGPKAPIPTTQPRPRKKPETTSEKEAPLYGKHATHHHDAATTKTPM
ncbi:D-amino acid dehydrogenase [Pokkaliibacter sp. CJK22405]|uniref:D-amino acid dehydrogenase n=1 Tax=Pokkaliibacter sp. CJK22405 TaxID=3384615 RepID=UPI0039850AE7